MALTSPLSASVVASSKWTFPVSSHNTCASPMNSRGSTWQRAFATKRDAFSSHTCAGKHSKSKFPTTWRGLSGEGIKVNGRQLAVHCTESTNGAPAGASSASAPDGRFRSGISLERLLKASQHLGQQLPAGSDSEGRGQGLAALSPLDIGDKAPCPRCQALGAVDCATCATSGLYVDAVMESQGVMVKVKCLGCGGSGTILCPSCGGRGYS